MAKLKKIKIMSQSTFEDLSSTSDNELNFVQTGKLCEVVFTGLAINNVYSKNLPVSLPIDDGNVFCNIYAKVVTATTYYAKGDTIPLSSLWGTNYRPLGAWFNKTQCGFNTSDQMTANNKGQPNAGTNIIGNIEIHFDFYLIG